MENSTISNLTPLELTEMSGTEEIPVAHNGENYKMSVAPLLVATQRAQTATQSATQATERSITQTALAQEATTAAGRATTAANDAKDASITQTALARKATEDSEAQTEATREATQKAIQDAEAATQQATAATQQATQAADNASQKAALAAEATQAAVIAKENAEEAIRNADSATSAAQSATQASATQTEATKTATQEAVKAVEDAVSEAEKAVDTAVQSANSATSAAQSATQEAISKTTLANQAADAANSAAQSATQATQAANNAAAAIDGRATALEVITAILERDLGRYVYDVSTPLAVGASGKYVDVNGDEVSKSTMGISSPMQFKAGDTYLYKSTDPVSIGTALFARKVTNTYDKVIEYSFTYLENGSVATATADYDQTKVYTYNYDAEGTLTNITDADGDVLEELPVSRQVTESFYEPLFRTNNLEMPKSGYYLFLCPRDMEVVVSGFLTDLNGGTLLGVRYGVLASIATNFVGTPGQKVIAQDAAETHEALKALRELVDNAGYHRAICHDSVEYPRVAGHPMYLEGVGAPSTPPDVPFQEYYDATNKKFYKAACVMGGDFAVSDWVLLN